MSSPYFLQPLLSLFFCLRLYRIAIFTLDLHRSLRSHLLLFTSFSVLHICFIFWTKFLMSKDSPVSFLFHMRFLFHLPFPCPFLLDFVVTRHKLTTIWGIRPYLHYRSKNLLHRNLMTVMTTFFPHVTGFSKYFLFHAILKPRKPL